jgi:hypothetical protein
MQRPDEIPEPPLAPPEREPWTGWIQVVATVVLSVEVPRDASLVDAEHALEWAKREVENDTSMLLDGSYSGMTAEVE